MENLLIEKVSLWDYLKTAKKPIFLYGMGDGAVKINDVLQKVGVEISGVFASDEFVRGHSFLGYRVKKFSEVKAENNDFIVLLSFATELPYLMERIYNMQKECELYAPDVPVIPDGEIFDLDYIKRNNDSLKAVYDMLADEKSRKVFLDVLNFKISGKIDYLKDCESDISEVYENLIKPTPDGVYIDLGAYNGDTISEYLSYAKDAKKIIAFEPDKKNYKKLLSRIENENIKNAECLNIGAWNEEDALYFALKGGRNSKLVKEGELEIPCNSVDNVSKGLDSVDVIKFDVEGAEEKAIEGCRETILHHKPKLMVSAYHKNEDIFKLALKIAEIRGDYKVYLRHHPYIPAWETNYYFI